MSEGYSDGDLLRRFAVHRDREALDVLIRRYMGAVYASARRQTGGDAAATEDVTQAVFLVLMRRAAAVPPMRVGGWLMRTTHLTAADWRKRAARRSRHEQRTARERTEVSAMPEHVIAADGPTALWPVIDAAIAGLSPVDREVVVLRFMRGIEVHDIAGSLGLSEVATRKRITRAVGRLRRACASRGVQAATPSLVAALPTIAAESAPPTVLSSTRGLITNPNAAPIAVVELSQGVLHMMLIRRVKIALLLLVAVALAVAFGIEVSQRTLAQEQSLPAEPAETAPAPVPVAQEWQQLANPLDTRQGGWRLTRLVDSGRSMPDEDLLKAHALIHGDELIVALPPTLFPGRPVPEVPRPAIRMQRSRLKFDVSVSPVHVDLFPVRRRTGEMTGRSDPGLARLDAQELTFVFDEMTGRRPTAFASEAAASSPNDLLFVLRPDGADRRAEAGTPESLARAFVAALVERQPTEAIALRVTGHQFATAFAGEGIDQHYLRLSASYDDAALTLAVREETIAYVGLVNAEQVRPRAVEAGQALGPLRAKLATEVIDNVRVAITLDGRPAELTLDEMIKLDGSWRLLGPARLNEEKR